MWYQRTITLKPRPRGFHLVTDELLTSLGELKKIRVGLAHFFLLHTSASLAINENASSDVRQDFESHFNAIVPENATYVHDEEGSDDMPAHIKSMMVGVNQTVPIRDGELALGTWQGLYLCEHRDQGPPRTVVVTLLGEGATD